MNSRPRRRPFPFSLRFSLRAFFVAVLIVALLIGWKVRSAERQRRAVAWAQEVGLEVFYSEEPSGWLAEHVGSLIGVDYFSVIIEVFPLSQSQAALSEIKTISPLAGVSIQTLSLSGTDVTDITPLGTSKHLRLLSLSNTRVSDLSALSGQSNLEVVYLGETQVSDLGPLAELTKLEWVYLDNTRVSDLSALSGQSNLEELDASSTLVTDISPLKGLRNLQRLNLKRTAVFDLTPLSDAVGLVVLDISESLVSDLATLACMPRLHELHLYDTRVGDLSPLAANRALVRLSLDSTGVVDLSALSEVTTLKDLSLERTSVTDVRPLAKLTLMERLNLSGTGITDVSPLGNMANLWRLDLNYTSVDDLTVLSRLKSLDELELGWTEVVDLRPLGRLSALRRLDLSYTKVLDISPLSRLTALERLDLSGTLVSDLSPLRGLIALRSLNLSNSRVIDLSPIIDLPCFGEALRTSKAVIPEALRDRLKKEARDRVRGVVGGDAAAGVAGWVLFDSSLRAMSQSEAGEAQATCARSLGVELELTNTLGMKLKLIPPGRFLMGSPTWEEGRDEDEDQVEVTLAEAFYIGSTEVTLGQYLKYYHASPGKNKTEGERDGEGGWGYNDDGSDNPFEQSPKYTPWSPGFRVDETHPVSNVSWNDAVGFCDWLTLREREAGRLGRRQRYQLPTEAQWEYACRAGTQTAYHSGDDKATLVTMGNVNDASAKERLNLSRSLEASDGHAFTAPVGSYSANGFGLHDMHGNVEEWCLDGYRYPRNSLTGGLNPLGTGSSRVFRGGGWLGDPSLCRSAARDGYGPSDRFYDLGFRVALVGPVMEPRESK